MKRWSIALTATMMLLASIRPSVAQDNSPESDPLNHAYAVYLGSGVYVAGGRTVFVFRVAPKFRILSEEQRSFGIRLRLNATFGFYNLRGNDFPGFNVPDRVNSFAFVPGVEFPIKLYENWTLMPFLDFGAARDDEFKETTLVHGVGFRSRAEFEDTRHIYVLWNELIAAGNSSTDFSPQDNYTVFKIDFEMRGIIDYTLGGRSYDLGLLAKADFYLDPLLIEPPTSPTFEVNQLYQIGFTTGPMERWKPFKWVTMPRFGLTYGFGERVSGVGFLFRFRY